MDLTDFSRVLLLPSNHGIFCQDHVALPMHVQVLISVLLGTNTRWLLSRAAKTTMPHLNVLLLGLDFAFSCTVLGQAKSKWGEDECGIQDTLV